MLLLVAVGDSSDHSGRPGQGRGAAGSQRSHEEPEDPPGAPDVFSGQQEQTLHTDLNPEFLPGFSQRKETQQISVNQINIS